MPAAVRTRPITFSFATFDSRLTGFNVSFCSGDKPNRPAFTGLAIVFLVIMLICLSCGLRMRRRVCQWDGLDCSVVLAACPGNRLPYCRVERRGVLNNAAA